MSAVLDRQVGRMTVGQRARVFVRNSPARMAVIIALFLFAVTVAINPKSFNMSAFSSILLLTLLLSFAAAGQTIVLIGGGLDFTVGAVMSAAAILTTYVMNGQNGQFLLVFGLAMAMGAAIGLVNGICSVKIDLPLFGIVNDSAGSLLLMLPPEKTLEETPKEETCVPLWTRRSTAESFLAECSPDFSEPHHIVEFGPKDMPDLIEQLRGLAEWSDVVAFNLFDTDAAPCPILRLADDLERIWNRVIQAGATGILQTIYQTMVVDSREIGSVLLSTGEYAAMELPNGPVLKGSSREEAINRAIGGPSRGPNVTE